MLSLKLTRNKEIIHVTSLNPIVVERTFRAPRFEISNVLEAARISLSRRLFVIAKSIA